ncbi:MAG: hypothetical protein OEZ59_10990 [Deltaproteobacteria bacterium]|nr:hypothetical protein [Deltaproteobacteria bacterium]
MCPVLMAGRGDLEKTTCWPRRPAVWAALLALALLIPGATAQAAERRTLVVAATGDLKGWVTRELLYPRGKPGGLAHLAREIRHLQKTHPGLVLLDAGDAFSESPDVVLALTGGKAPSAPPILTLMNQLGYSAAVLGNMDLAWGWETLGVIIRQASFPMLAANLEPESPNRAPSGARPPGLVPYALLERDGLRVAVLGLTAPGLGVGREPSLLAGYRVTTPEEAARRWVPLLRESLEADLVLGLVHAGLDDDFDRSTALRLALPGLAGAGRLAARGWGLDLLVSGGAHRLSPLKREDAASPHAVPVLETGARGEALVLAELELEATGGRWQVTGMKRRPVLALDTADPEALGVTAPQLEKTRAWLAEPLAFRISRKPRKKEFHACAGDLQHLALTGWAGKHQTGGSSDTAGESASRAITMLPHQWRYSIPLKEERERALTRADLYRWIPYGDTPWRVLITARQMELLLEPYVRNQRGWKTPPSLVLWPGGLQAVLPETPPSGRRGSELAGLRALPVFHRASGPAGEGPFLPRDSRHEVWLTGYIRHGGGGLAARALIHPEQDGAQPPQAGRVSIRELVLGLLQEPKTILPPACKNWLAGNSVNLN